MDREDIREIIEGVIAFASLFGLMFMGFINFLLRKFTSTVKKLNDLRLKKIFFHGLHRYFI